MPKAWEHLGLAFMAEETVRPGGERIILHLDFQLCLRVLTGVHPRELALEGGAVRDKARRGHEPRRKATGPPLLGLRKALCQHHEDSFRFWPLAVGQSPNAATDTEFTIICWSSHEKPILPWNNGERYCRYACVLWSLMTLSYFPSL